MGRLPDLDSIDFDIPDWDDTVKESEKSDS
jgi:hypothetical protein